MPCFHARTEKNNHIMFSDNIHFWQNVPNHPGTSIRLGIHSNWKTAAHPLKTDEGWIVLTHGVGPMRQYCIGAILLDLEKPHKNHRPFG